MNDKTNIYNSTPTTARSKPAHAIPSTGRKKDIMDWTVREAANGERYKPYDNVIYPGIILYSSYITEAHFGRRCVRPFQKTHVRAQQRLHHHHRHRYRQHYPRHRHRYLVIQWHRGERRLHRRRHHHHQHPDPHYHPRHRHRYQRFHWRPGERRRRHQRRHHRRHRHHRHPVIVIIVRSMVARGLTRLLARGPGTLRRTTRSLFQESS